MEECAVHGTMYCTLNTVMYMNIEQCTTCIDCTLNNVLYIKQCIVHEKMYCVHEKNYRVNSMTSETTVRNSSRFFLH